MPPILFRAISHSEASILPDRGNGRKAFLALLPQRLGLLVEREPQIENAQEGRIATGLGDVAGLLDNPDGIRELSEFRMRRRQDVQHAGILPACQFAGRRGQCQRLASVAKLRQRACWRSDASPTRAGRKRGSCSRACS